MLLSFAHSGTFFRDPERNWGLIVDMDMDSDAYRSFADEKIIEDTKQEVMAIMDQIPNTLAKP
jgi:hypothetical protein